MADTIRMGDSDKLPPTAKPAKREALVSAHHKPESWFDRTVGKLFSGDRASVTGYLVNQVVVPSLKRLLSDGLSTAVQIMVYGEDRPSRGGGESYYSGRNNGSYYHASSRRYAEPERREPYRYEPYRMRATSVRNIAFRTREDAIAVLDRCIADANQWGSVSVGALLAYSGLTGYPSDESYGWTERDVKNAAVVNVRGDWIIELGDPRSV